jgi:hypothetical protein
MNGLKLATVRVGDTGALPFDRDRPPPRVPADDLRWFTYVKVADGRETIVARGRWNACLRALAGANAGGCEALRP